MSATQTTITFLPPEAIRSRLDNRDHPPQVVFVGAPGQAPPAWLPGSIQLGYNALVTGAPPAPGLMPPIKQVLTSLAASGIDIHRDTVAWDMGASGMAARFAFTVACVNGARVDVLDGGLPAWSEAGFDLVGAPAATNVVDPTPVDHYSDTLVSADELMQRADELLLVDTRSATEFEGTEIRAMRAGHMPGAVNLNWTDLMDARGRLLPRDQLLAVLDRVGVPPPTGEVTDREIVVYCQTHHRSAHTYAVLRQLGYTKVRGYAGAWGEWASRAELPIEI